MAKGLHTWMGWKDVTLNWHLLVHWHSVVEIHGPVRGYWAWVMERYHKLLRLIYTTHFKNVHVRASWCLRFLDFFTFPFSFFLSFV